MTGAKENYRKKHSLVGNITGRCELCNAQVTWELTGANLPHEKIKDIPVYAHVAKDHVLLRCAERLRSCNPAAVEWSD